MIVVGLDMSTRCTGYAVVDWRGSIGASPKPSIGCFALPAAIDGRRPSGHDAVRHMAADTRAVLEDVARLTDTAVVAIEDGAAWNSGTTTRMLAELRGAAISEASRLGFRHWLRMPASWRKIACGHGHMLKADVACLMGRMWGFNHVVPPWDQWEALGVATAYCLSDETERLVAKPPKRRRG